MPCVNPSRLLSDTTECHETFVNTQDPHLHAPDHGLASLSACWSLILPARQAQAHDKAVFKHQTLRLPVCKATLRLKKPILQCNELEDVRELDRQHQNLQPLGNEPLSSEIRLRPSLPTLCPRPKQQARFTITRGLHSPITTTNTPSRIHTTTARTDQHKTTTTAQQSQTKRAPSIDIRLPRRTLQNNPLPMLQ